MIESIIFLIIGGIIGALAGNQYGRESEQTYSKQLAKANVDLAKALDTEANEVEELKRELAITKKPKTRGKAKKK
jgi:hypothetical protein